jgi:hypothetical protein
MPPPRTPENLDLTTVPAPSAGTMAPAGPSHANPVTRIQIRAGGYIARHPTLLRVLEWLSWNNTGGSINP